MTKISFQIFDLILLNFISFFWDFNGGSTRKGHLQILVLKSKEKKWWNAESARPSTLLKLESTTDIFIDQVHKFQNNDFKEYSWKAATILQKSMYFKNMLWNMLMILEKVLPLKLTETLTFVSSLLNIVHLGVLNFLFTTSGQCAKGGKWKKLLIGWNEY